MASSQASSVLEIVQLRATSFRSSTRVHPGASESLDNGEDTLPERPLASFAAEFNGSKYTNPTDLELAMSLECLSCIQSEQIIPIQKIWDVVIPSLSRYLSRGISNVDDTSCSNNIQNGSSQENGLFSKIERDIKATKEKFERLKQWEKDLDLLVKDLLVRDWDQEVNLSEMDKRLTNLRQHIEPPWSAIPVDKTAGDDRGQSPSSNISTAEKESLDQSFNVKYQATIPSQDILARYNDLSPQLKKCLLYFSAFPANSKIRKKTLTYLWIGEGFIDTTHTDDLSSEQIAENYFEKLVTEGFIEPVDEKDSRDFSSCKMKPSIHSCIAWLAKYSDFFDFDASGMPTTNYIRSHRACLSGTDNGSTEQLVNLIDDSHPGKLYTLFNLDETFPYFSAGWFSKVNNLLTLCLGSWQSSKGTSVLVENVEFLKDLSHLKLLRCLSLNRVYGVKKLPKSICKLLNLRILDLKACYDLRELPEEIGSLVNLTHLDMSECHLIDYMPKGLSMLVKLLVLKGFVISGDPTTSRGQCTLADLVALEKLRKLSIYTHSNITGNEGQLNSLSKFKALQVLTISWIRATRHENVEAAATPSSLPPSLQKLDLRGWPLQKIPRWVNLSKFHKLNKLYIRGGRLDNLSQEMDPPYQWTVKILRLQYLKDLRMNWQKARQLFPKLVYLNKIDCPKLVCFPVDGEWRPDNNRSEEGIHDAGNA